MEYSRKLKQQHQQQPQDNNQRHSNTNSRCNSGNINTISNRQNRRLVFSSPTSKLRLSSAVRILHATNLNEINYDLKLKEARMRFIDKTLDNSIDFGLPSPLRNFTNNNNYYYCHYNNHNNNNTSNNNNNNNNYYYNNLSWDLRWRKLRAIFS